MKYCFPPDVEDRVHARMATGQYPTEDDLLREALDTLDAVEGEARDVQAAIDAVKQGDPAVPLNEAFDALRRKHNLPADA
jgi:Arc/MetJ-type ribon-helix-helix transcriptional regulator